MNFQTRKKLTLKGAAQAERVRTKCNVGRTSTVDPIAVAEQRGCEIRFMSLSSFEGIYAPEPRATIVLGSERPAGRRAFTCAHELGHHEFKHGMCVDELKDNHGSSDNQEEFLADMFAAALLMPKAGILKALRARGYDPEELNPVQVYKLASFFGVGFRSIIEHMTWTLNVLNQTKRSELIKTAPKEIKSAFGGTPQGELIFADEHWTDRAIDIEVGDILALPLWGIIDGQQLETISIIDGHSIFKANKQGYARAYSENPSWAANIRIAPKNYTGLAKFRFLDDPEEN